MILPNDHRVVITECSLSEDPDRIFKMAKDDPTLISAIISYGYGMKIIKRVKNIILTDRGYFCAFYATDLEEVLDN